MSDLNLKRLVNRILGSEKEIKDSQYFVENCGKELFGTQQQLEDSIDRINQKHDTNKETLIRIVKSWKAMKHAANNLPEEYKIAGQWASIIESAFSPLINALNNEDLTVVDKLFVNLFRNFGDFFGEPRNYHDAIYKQQKVERFKVYSSRWLELYGEKFIAEVADPQIGNPVGFIINDNLYTQGNFINNYFARRIKDLTSEKDEPIVCEIGGGFGGVAYHLIKEIPNINYIDFDIPLIALTSAYYLMTAYPEGSIGLFGEVDNLEDPFKKHKIVIAPNYAIRSIKDNFSDVCLNKCSFAEMDKTTVIEYMSQFERICQGYILHMNHSWEPDSKNAFYKPSGNFKHWNLSEVEPSNEKFKRIYKIPAPFQSDFHGEFFEWLYEKRQTV